MTQLRRYWRRSLVIGIVAVGVIVAFVAVERRSDPPLGFAAGTRGALRPIDRRPPGPVRGFGTIEGTLTRKDGSPADACLVSARPIDAPGLARVTVYSKAGHFRISRLPAARYQLEAHDSTLAGGPGKLIDVGAGATASVEITLGRAFADPYPASYYAARLHFPSKATQTNFRVQCRYCHQFGTVPTRQRRSRAEWDALIQVMSGMGAALEPETRKILPGVLAEGMRPDRPTAAPPPGPKPDAMGAVIREWALGMPGAYMHDLALGPKDWIYAVDMNHDVVSGLNTRTGESWDSTLPPRGHPRGGYFRVASQAIGTTAAHQGPHSVEYADGRLWVTASLGNELIAVTPTPRGATQHWSLPRGSFYPHTLRVRKDAAWFTIAITNQVGRFDRKSGKFTIVPLPTSRLSQKVTRALMPFVFGLGSFWPGSNMEIKYLPRSFGGTSSTPVPYGLDIAPDGAIWYSKLYDDRIGRIDPHTLKIQEWVTPFAAPRRLRVARDGSVWIPGFGSSLLARFDPKTQTFKTWPLPSNPPGLDAPYAVAISPNTGRIWVTSTQTDLLYRFDPVQQHFTVFPLPTRGAFMREIEFRPDGELCTTYSNNPDSHMPDPTLKILCLKPPPN